ncbi:twin-arginine translocation pathway signal [Mucilaginibacter sp. PAMC 26640]|nr:twin-arginine translocation pathway signal [Mucilaginibacter sp. PAMC 26640]
MKRRDFLRNSALASGAFLIPSFLKPLEAMAINNLSGHKNLVIIQLSGGNDGLNTIVPYANDIYYQKRQTIAIKQPDIIKLTDLQGLNPNLGALKEIYDQGWMSVINSVGYPNPDRSHFRSMDIWQTGSDANQFLTTGWIGRYLDSNCSTCQHPYTAIEVDDTLSLAMKGGKMKGIAVEDPGKLYQATRNPYFKQLINEHAHSNFNEDNLGYLYKTMIETNASAEYIQQTSKTYTTNSQYPQTPFANQLKTVAKFINSGLKTRVYYVSLSGFDTHTTQQNQQGRQLKIYGDAVAAFVKDLKQAGKLDDTLVMTFSEFGRRVEQNASNGTDHGTANNVMIFGGKLKKQGIYNNAPNLSQLDNGDLKYEIDFRDVYATLLDKWLDVNNSQVLNKNFSGLGFV